MIEPLPLSVALASTPQAEQPKQSFAWVASLGARAVQLDATQRGMRPRELDLSARRDIAGSASRSEVAISGLDLWIPPGHFADESRVDRAAQAVIDAIGLLADLSRLGAARPGSAISLMFAEATEARVIADLCERADRAGVVIADHAPSPAEQAMVGADPALLLMAGYDPCSAARMNRLATARLSDANAMGRCAVGVGELDVLEYAMTLTTSSYRRPVVIDVRGLPNAQLGIERAVAMWRQATELPGA